MDSSKELALVTIRTSDGQEYCYKRHLDERIFDDYEDDYFEMRDKNTIRRFYTSNVISVTVVRLGADAKS